MNNVKIKMTVVLKDGEKMEDFKPFKARKKDAAFDLMAAIDDSVVIRPNETKLVSAGFKMQLEDDYVALICSRSGNALNKGLQIGNCPGVIDCGYTGEIGVIVYNANSDKSLVISRGDKIAQMIIQKLPKVDLEFVAEIDENTERGANGFGSSDKKN